MNIKAHKKTKHRGTDITPAKKRIFTYVTISAPVVILLLLEILLRGFHYGSDLSLFVKEEISNNTYYVMNPDVKARYFSRVEFSPNTSLDYFSVPKPAGAFRIFLLGGSTTVGYPYGYIGSFSTFLRDRINKIFPERKIEIINLGMTATNSYTVVDIAQELIDYEPDLMIVYDGHNEFYGALGIASRESISNIRWLTKTYLKLVQLKTFQLVKNAYSSVAGSFKDRHSEDRPGSMMERLAYGNYIPYGSKPYRECLQNFNDNLKELVSMCREKKIPLILSSQVSNLRDQKPFVSSYRPGMTGDQKKEFDILLSSAARCWNRGRIDSALIFFGRSARLDSLRGDVHFELARCLDSCKQTKEALNEYIKARDCDQLRFRTSSDFNQAIRLNSDGSKIFFADIEQLFSRQSPDSIIGQSLILEHLHPILYGNFLIGNEYVRIIRQAGLFASISEWQQRDTIPDDVLWDRRVITQIDEAAALRRIEILTSAWPFTKGTVTREKRPTDTGVLKIVDRLVHAEITWEQAHVMGAEYFTKKGDLVSAEKEYRALINQIPLNVSAYLVLAQLLIQHHNAPRAVDLLLRSLKIEPTVFACKSLGMFLLDSSKSTEAIPYLEKAIELSQDVNDYSESGYLLGLAYSRLGMHDRAVTQLEDILQRNPHYGLAENLLHHLRNKQ